MENKQLKILVCGDAEGNFKTLFSRVTNIQKKNGPFDLLLCVGDFFGNENEEWNRILKGELSVPITVLILGANQDAHCSYYPEKEGCELYENILYLGKQGVFTTSSGLQIAYLSGRQCDTDYGFTVNDVDDLINSVSSSKQFKGVDILITSQWPKGVEKYAGDVFLYAFHIEPLINMDNIELIKQPEDATECPYQLSQLQDSRVKDEGQQFFFDMKAPLAKGQKRSKDDEDKQKKKHKPAQPSGPCWFCLRGEKVEKHLVVSVGETTYMALAKGAMVPDHVLILPIGHYQSTVVAPSEVCLGKVVVFFERNYKTSHLQIQAIPVPANLACNITDTFTEFAVEESIDLNEIPKHSDLKQIVNVEVPYFYVEVPTGEKFLCRISKGFPLQFGRDVLASPILLNMPERINWKSCTESQEEEKQMAQEFKKKFKDFDFNFSS
uniref:Cwf19-like C-terminal domain-containing protein n=1 Tax=Octopus bimaculoides TaxID=37653 RepID=A0A0L8G1K5_OCTBM